MSLAEDRLPAFEGMPVVRSAVRITRAGDGLSEALRLDPRALHRGDEVFFVLKGEVDQVNFRPVSREEDDVLSRVHTVRASEIALVSREDVEHLLQSERLRLKHLEDEAALRAPLPGFEDETPPSMQNVDGQAATNIFGGTFDERGPIEDDEPAVKKIRRPRKVAAEQLPELP